MNKPLGRLGDANRQGCHSSSSDNRDVNFPEFLFLFYSPPLFFLFLLEKRSAKSSLRMARNCQRIIEESTKKNKEENGRAIKSLPEGEEEEEEEEEEVCLAR